MSRNVLSTEQAEQGLTTAQLKLAAAQAQFEQEQTRLKNTPLYQRSRLLLQFEQTKKAVDQAQTHYQQALNGVAASRRQAQLQQSRAVEQSKQDQVQAKHSQAEEAQAKETAQTRFLAAGGTPAQFEQSWSLMWQAELDQRVIERQQLEKRRSVAYNAF